MQVVLFVLGVAVGFVIGYEAGRHKGWHAAWRRAIANYEQVVQDAVRRARG